MLERPISKAGWTRVAFGEVVRLSKARVADPEAAGIERFVGLEHIEPGDLRIRLWGDVADGTTFTTLFKSGQILFGKRRAYQRKVAVADFEGVCSGDIYVLEPANERLMPELLPFLCQTDAFFDHAVGTSAGSLSPRTNWTSLASFEFLLPPIQEQARFVEVSSAASALRATSLDLNRSTMQLIDALSENLFLDILKAENARRTTIADVFEQVVDRGYSGLALLSVTIDGRVVRREELERHVSDDTGEEKYLRVMPGDLAYNTMRLWQGAIGIVQEEGLISPAYTVMRPKTPDTDVLFFWELLRSTVMQREYRKLVTGVASDRWRLYFKDLAKVSLVLPESAKHSDLWNGLKQLRGKHSTVRERLRSMDSTIKLIHEGFFSQ